MTITFHIFKENVRVDIVEYAAPLTAGDAERGLQDEDSSWIGALQAEGTSVPDCHLSMSWLMAPPIS